MFTFFTKLINDAHFNTGDGIAGGLWFLVWLKWIPHITAVLSLIWVGLRLWVTIRDDFLNRKSSLDEHK